MYQEITQERLDNIHYVIDATPAEAKSIYHQMQCNGFDFSEATDRQFKVGVQTAKIDLGLEAITEDALEALYMSL